MLTFDYHTNPVYKLTQELQGFKMVIEAGWQVVQTIALILILCLPTSYDSSIVYYF